MTKEIKFGTDGWRAIIAEDFTFDNVRACAQSAAMYVKDEGLAPRGLVVGYDTRFASEHFAAAVAEVLAANDVKAFLCPQATPTQVASYGIIVKKAAGAVIITASHNPAIYNGFKYKPEYAGSASPEVVAEIERRLPAILASGEVQRMSLDDALKRGLIEYFDPSPPYLQHLGELVNLDKIRQAGLKVAIDSMYGAGAGYFKSLVGGGKTEIVEINAERNPAFPGIRPEPITENLTKLAATVKDSGASVGLATDGDADRIGILDEKGNFVTQLQVFALLALYLLEVRGERGAIVKSLTTTSMMYKLSELFNVPVFETAVGFKYLGPKMMAENALIGGEESGGFGFRGHIPERDGLLAGLYFLDLMISLGKTPSQLVEYLYSKVGPHYYERVDLPFPPAERQNVIDRVTSHQPAEIEGIKVVKMDATDGFRYMLADGTWLLIRFSGTEPILRIYAETDSPERVKRLLAEGRRLAGV